MAILLGMFAEREFKIRTGWFKVFYFKIGARQQKFRAEDLVEGGLSEKQAIENVKDSLDWLDQIL